MYLSLNAVCVWVYAWEIHINPHMKGHKLYFDPEACVYCVLENSQTNYTTIKYWYGKLDQGFILLNLVKYSLLV